MADRVTETEKAAAVETRLKLGWALRDVDMRALPPEHQINTTQQSILRDILEVMGVNFPWTRMQDGAPAVAIKLRKLGTSNGFSDASIEQGKVGIHVRRLAEAGWLLVEPRERKAYLFAPNPVMVNQAYDYKQTELDNPWPKTPSLWGENKGTRPADRGVPTVQ